MTPENIPVPSLYLFICTYSLRHQCILADTSVDVLKGTGHSIAQNRIVPSNYSYKFNGPSIYRDPKSCGQSYKSPRETVSWDSSDTTAPCSNSVLRMEERTLWGPGIPFSSLLSQRIPSPLPSGHAKVIEGPSQVPRACSVSFLYCQILRQTVVLLLHQEQSQISTYL